MARHFGLTDEAGRYGPDEYVSVVPPREADVLARHLVAIALSALPITVAKEANSIPAIEVADVVDAEVKPPRVRRGRLQLRADQVPSEPDPDAYLLGLALSLSAVPDLLDPAHALLVRRLTPQLNPEREVRRPLGMMLVVREAHLWELTAKYGGLSSTIPYALRVRALRWWWEPQHGRTPRPTLCIRCGQVELASAFRTGPPFCRRCLDKKALTHPRAIAPAEAGTWWLRCAHEGCSKAFVARAQARYCPEHRYSRISPRQRARRHAF
jgi:hypothetical protein